VNQTPVPLTGLPDGVVALPPTKADGTLARDRRGRVKTGTSVTLTAAYPADDPVTTSGFTDRDALWAARARRSLDAWTSRYGPDAPERVHAAIRAGLVTAKAATVDGIRLGEIRRTYPTTAAAAWADGRLSATSDATGTAAGTARAAADQIRDLDPGLAQTLSQATGREPHLPVWIAAAHDLATGVSHDGPRAFNQHHFQDTKAYTNPESILTDAGAAPETLDTLGLTRTRFLGLAGTVTATHPAGATLTLTGAPGPTILRIDPNSPWTLTVHPNTRALLVVENLQAAETTAVEHPDCITVYTNGQPSPAVLTAIHDLAAQTPLTVIATDADLGGVRIAARIHDALPPHVLRFMADPADVTSVRGEPFTQTVLDLLRRHGQRPDLIGHFADRIATRGYRVEQEAAICAAVTAVLTRSTRATNE
jgi:hypothetical protein